MRSSVLPHDGAERPAFRAPPLELLLDRQHLPRLVAELTGLRPRALSRTAPHAPVAVPENQANARRTPRLVALLRRLGAR